MLANLPCSGAARGTCCHLRRLPTNAIPSMHQRAPKVLTCSFLGERWNALSFVSNKPKPESLLREVLDLAEGTQWGQDIDQGNRDKVSVLVGQITLAAGFPATPALSNAAGGAAGNKSCQKLQGGWDLVYTTEDSVHKIVGGLLLGLRVKSISQSVDVSGLRVTNRIQFAQLGAAIEAGAPATIAGKQRLQYSFDIVYLEILGLRFPLPFAPRGGGWTEAVFVDERYRLMRNSLGDTLLFERSS